MAETKTAEAPAEHPYHRRYAWACENREYSTSPIIHEPFLERVIPQDDGPTPPEILPPGTLVVSPPSEIVYEVDRWWTVDVCAHYAGYPWPQYRDRCKWCEAGEHAPHFRTWSVSFLVPGKRNWGHAGANYLVGVEGQVQSLYLINGRTLERDRLARVGVSGRYHQGGLFDG